ncbi:MAG TPA: hypothetical protein VFL27_13745 [Candidatus Dormibacteraeota bacterium]|nr:hypothetical protein [Candidatus Dormibacteraeota bacterium]
MTVPIPLRLRPLEIGDVLDETFRMYRRHFLLFASLSMIFAIPGAALFGLAFGSFSVATTSGTTDATSAFVALAFIGVALLVGVLILPFTHTAVIYAACESAQGRPVTAGGVLGGVGRRYFPLLAYWLIFNVYTLYLAIGLCVAPAILWIWGFVGWFVVTPVMFVEHVGLGAAFGRSWDLVRGRWWRTFLIVFLLVILWFLVDIGLGAFVNLAQLLLGIFISPFLATVVSTVGGQLIAALANPIMQIALVFVYFDLRVRKEALDLFQHAYRLAAPQVAS